MAMHDSVTDSPSDWDRLHPVLDAAIGELSTSDRDAVLLRFFERRDFSAVGAALGVSEDAAQKRVARALDKLRTILTQRGVNLPAAALAAAISGGAVQTAPAGIGAFVATTALTSAAAVTTVTQATITTMNWLSLKAVAAVVGGAIVAGTVTYLVQQREVERLRADRRDLLVQQETLRAEQVAASAATQLKESELERLRKEASELVRLRGEVATLRRGGGQTPPRETPQTDPFRPRSALQTEAWQVGQVRAKMLSENPPTAAELAWLISVKPQVEEHQKWPEQFAVFQAGQIASVLGIQDASRVWDLRRIIEQAREAEHGQGLDFLRLKEIPRQLPVEYVAQCKQRRDDLQDQTTQQIRTALTETERVLFDRAFPRPLDIDLGLTLEPADLSMHPDFKDLTPEQIASAAPRQKGVSVTRATFKIEEKDGEKFLTPLGEEKIP